MSKTREKKSHRETFCSFILLDTLKNTFWTENLTLKWTHNQDFFPKKPGEASPIPLSCAPVSLNMPKYPWRYLKKLVLLCQGREDAWPSYMFDRILKMSRVLNKPEFWIWHGCICKGCAKFQICLIMAPNALLMPEYAPLCLMSLHMPGHGWILLNVLEEYT